MGWTGNGLAGLVLCIGLLMAGNSFYSAWNATTTASFKITAPDGAQYIVVGSRSIAEAYGQLDALNAVKKHLGEANVNVLGTWAVFSLDLPNDLAKMNALESAARRLELRKELPSIYFTVGIALAVATLVFLFGRACRYILSGPRIK